MRKFALAATLVALVGFAPASQAVPVDIQYNVSITAAVVSGLIPVGTFSGTSTIRFRGTGTISNPIVAPGAAQFMSWNTTGPILVNHVLLGGAVVTGAQTLVTGAQQKGNLTAGGLPFLPLQATGFALAHCNSPGAQCTNPPIGIPKSIPISGPLPISTVVGALAAAPITTGLGDAKATFTLFAFLGSFGGLPISGTAVFTEVGRTQVPEPSSLSMLWVGLAGLAGSASWRRRRARR